ncbi:beta-glucosidase [Parenemella sanctibonifatiensis]|uniref:Beta-glucosidase n=1 Tax=Parenemella sanctibonifatiensis TaxID=2016505 RepID=A0A255EAT5_9ACTN|nr:beta-glucosidase [Parenemella sanctibonifatiensis]
MGPDHGRFDHHRPARGDLLRVGAAQSGLRADGGGGEGVSERSVTEPPVRIQDPDADVLALLLPPLPAGDVDEVIEDALRAGLGGVVYFAHDVPTLARARELSDRVHRANPDAVVAIDEEGGPVTRLFSRFSGLPGQARTEGPLPSAGVFGRVDDPELTREAGVAMGAVLTWCGIDLDFAPVADVNSNPDNPVIGLRAYAADPARVRTQSAAFAAGLHQAGVLSCAKHFPGHGDTATDSHHTLPTVEMPRDRFLAEHLAGFPLAEVDAVMTAHIEVPALGQGPASISRWSAELVAEQGFEGLVVTDALDMAAVSGTVGFPESCVRALEAGADLLCLGTSIRRDAHAMLDQAHGAIAAALASGRLDRSDLQTRAVRVRAARAVRRVAAEVADPTALTDELWRIGNLARVSAGLPALSPEAAAAGS